MIPFLATIGALILVVLFVSGAAVVQYVYPHTIETPGAVPEQYGFSYEPVRFITADGVQLRGWFLHGEGEEEKKPVILVGHGYPADKANVLFLTPFLVDAGYNVLLFDFRGFGESGGRTTLGDRERDDVRAAVAFLKEKDDVDSERIGAWGFSFSAAAFLMAEDPAIKAIVAEAPFSNLTALARDVFGMTFPGPFKEPFVFTSKIFARIFFGIRADDVSALRSVQRYHVPTLFIHGDNDRTIRPEHSARLFDAAEEPKQYWSIEGAGHGDAYSRAREEYQTKVRAFFQQYL